MSISLRVPLLVAQTANATQSIPQNVSAYSQLTFYITGNGTTSSGVITLEEADYDPSKGVPYGGTWSAITTINASTASGDNQVAYHAPAPTVYAWVRARISTVIGGGGTITVSLRAN